MTAPYPPPAPQPAPGGNNTQGLVAMILGIAAIPLVCCFYIGLPLGIVAAVLGVLGKQKADQGLASNRGQAMTGIITGGIAAAIGIILLVLVVIFNTVDLPTPGGGGS